LSGIRKKRSSKEISKKRLRTLDKIRRHCRNSFEKVPSGAENKNTKEERKFSNFIIPFVVAGATVLKDNLKEIIYDRFTVGV